MDWIKFRGGMQVLSILLVFSILLNVFFLFEKSSEPDVDEFKSASQLVHLTSTSSAPAAAADLSRETANSVSEPVVKKRPQRKSISQLEISDLLANFEKDQYMEGFANNCRFKGFCSPLISMLEGKISGMEGEEKKSRLEDLVEMRIRICEREASLPKAKGVWTIGSNGICQEKFEVTPSKEQLQRLTKSCEKLSAESCISLYHNDSSLSSDKKDVVRKSL